MEQDAYPDMAMEIQIKKNRIEDLVKCITQGRIQGGGRTRRAPPPKIGKNIIFWRKIVIFHTKYPKNFRASLRSAHFFLTAPPP